MLLENTEPAAQWFAAYTLPRHEKHVSARLRDRGLDAVLPLYQAVRQWKKSRAVALDLPLFPSYVFVHVPRSALATLLSVPGIHSIVGSGKEAWALPAQEIEALRAGSLLGSVTPHPYLRVGERVRIKAGLMAGVEGLLLRKKNEYRFVLTLEAIMKSVAVEVDADIVEPVWQEASEANAEVEPADQKYVRI